MKQRNQLTLGLPTTELEQRDVLEAFAIAEAAKEEAERLHVKAARADRDAEWFLDQAIRLSEALRRRRGDQPYIEGSRANIIDDPFDRTRERLVKALGLLRSDKIAERADAALKVEKLRAKMGMTWDELIVEEFDDHENEEDEDEEEDEKDFDDVEQELDLDSLDHDQDEGN